MTERNLTGSNKQINFRSSDDIQGLIDEIKASAVHSSTAEAIRNAVTLAYLSWCEYKAHLVLQNRTGVQQPMVIPEHIRTEGKADRIIQIRSNATLLEDLRRLENANFGTNKADIIRRSLTLYQQLLRKHADGWVCGVVDEAGQFTVMPLLTFIRPHRYSPQRETTPKPRPRPLISLRPQRRQP